MVIHRPPTPHGAGGGTGVYNNRAPSSPVSIPSNQTRTGPVQGAATAATPSNTDNTNNASDAPTMVEFLGLKEFACGAPPAVARGATGAEKMASSVLSFLKCAAGNAGQQVIEQVKSIEDSLSHGGFNSTFGSMSKESDGDTRDQPEIEGTSSDLA